MATCVKKTTVFYDTLKKLDPILLVCFYAVKKWLFLPQKYSVYMYECFSLLKLYYRVCSLTSLNRREKIKENHFFLKVKHYFTHARTEFYLKGSHAKFRTETNRVRAKQPRVTTGTANCFLVAKPFSFFFIKSCGYSHIKLHIYSIMDNQSDVAICQTSEN